MPDKDFSEVLSMNVGKLVTLKLVSGETIEGKLDEVGRDYCYIVRGNRIEIFNLSCVSRCVITEEKTTPKEDTS